MTASRALLICCSLAACVPTLLFGVVAEPAGNAQGYEGIRLLKMRLLQPGHTKRTAVVYLQPEPQSITLVTFERLWAGCAES